MNKLDLNSLVGKDTERVLLVVNALKACAQDKNVEPRSVSQSDFLKWCKSCNSFKNITSEELRNLGGYTTILNIFFPDHQAAPQILKTEAAIAKKATKEVVNRLSFLSAFEELIDRIPRIAIPKKRVHKVLYSNEEALLFLSDLHFGSDIKREDSCFAYGPSEEARSLASVLEQTVEDLSRMPVGKLHLVLAGDIIDGILHDARQAKNMATQVATAIHLLSQFILKLSLYVDELSITALPGNHDRIKSRHHERATFEKWDSYATMIYYAVKKVVEGVHNVTFQIPLTPYAAIPTVAGLLFTTHGDNLFDLGAPTNLIPQK